MKQIMILALVFINLFSMEVDYKYLQKSKQKYKEKKLMQRSVKGLSIGSKKLSKYKNHIKIMYKDSSKLDIDYLNKTYKLVLEKCVAKKTICIFKYTGSMQIEALMQKIKHEEASIKAVNKYDKYELKAF